MKLEDTCCSIVPYFSMNSGQEASFRQAADDMVALTSTEPKCLYYGFAYSDNEAFCREGYADADGVLKHVEHSGDALQKLLTFGQLTRLEVHGPVSELEKLKAPLAALNPKYFVLESGFRR